MAIDLKLAAIIGFLGADKFADQIRSLGGGVSGFVDRVTGASEKVRSFGEGLARAGEQIGLTTALLSEGANAMHEFTNAISEPAMTMEQSLATTAAMTGLNTDALAKLKDAAVEFSNTHPGVTAEQYIGNFTRMREIFQNTGQALKATDVVSMLSRFGLDAEDSSNIATAAFRNFGLSADETGDQVIAAVQAFGLVPTQARQLAQAIGYMGGDLKQTNSSFSELLSLAGMASQQLGGGGRGATRFASTIRELVTEGKSGIDFSHGLSNGLFQLRRNLEGMDSISQIGALRQMGVDDPDMMLTFLAHLDEVNAKQNQIADSAGRLGKAYGTATANAKDQIDKLHQNVENLSDALYSPVLPTVNRWLGDLTSVTQSASDATEHHSTIARYAAISMTGLGAASYYGLKGLSAFGTIAFGLGKGIDILGKFGDAETVLLHGMYAWDRVSSIVGWIGNLGSAINRTSIATYAWTAAQWALDAALDAAGIGEIILGVAALAAAVYEVYEHWGSIAGFFTGVRNRVASIDWHSLGVSILKNIGEGLLDATGIGYVIRGAEKIAGIISDHFPHSPARLGPLRSLDRIRIVESIAERMRPGPILSAMGRTASAVAIAMPMVATAAFAAPGAPGAAAVSAGAAPRGAAGIVVNYSPVVNGAGLTKEEMRHLLRDSARDLVQIIDRERATRERTSLS